jgi:hypothetical protein
MPAPMTSTPRWTGWPASRTTSRRSWPAATWRRSRTRRGWRCSTCRPPGWKARGARGPHRPHRAAGGRRGRQRLRRGFGGCDDRGGLRRRTAYLRHCAGFQAGVHAQRQLVLAAGTGHRGRGPAESVRPTRRHATAHSPSSLTMKGTNIAAAVASRHAPVTRPGVDRRPAPRSSVLARSKRHVMTGLAARNEDQERLSFHPYDEPRTATRTMEGQDD